MDFLRSPEQEELAASIGGYLDRHYPPERIRQMEADAEFPEELFHEMAEQGWLAVPVPGEYGGRGGSVADLSVLLEEIGKRHVAFSTMYITTAVFGTWALRMFGSEEQRAAHLPAIARGQVRFALGMTEPQSGSDFGGLTTRATPDGDGWVIDGIKGPCSAAERADFIITAARTDPEAQRHHGISLFLVPRESPGLTCHREEYQGFRALHVAEVHYDGVRVPPDAMLGEQNRGFYLLHQLMDLERIAASGQVLGVAQQAYDEAIAYAKERVLYGQPITEFQAIRHMIAGAYTDLQAARLMVRWAADIRDRGEPCPLEASMAKMHATNAAFRVTNMALQLQGAWGYRAENDMLRYFLSARGAELGGGTTQIQKNIIARFIGL